MEEPFFTNLEGVVYPSGAAEEIFPEICESTPVIEEHFLKEILDSETNVSLNFEGDKRQVYVSRPENFITINTLWVKPISIIYKNPETDDKTWIRPSCTPEVKQVNHVLEEYLCDWGFQKAHMKKQVDLGGDFSGVKLRVKIELTEKNREFSARFHSDKPPAIHSEEESVLREEMGFSMQDEKVIPKTSSKDYVLKKMLPSISSNGVLELNSENARISVLSKKGSYILEPKGMNQLLKLEEYYTTFQTSICKKGVNFVQFMIGEWEKCEIQSL